MRSLIFLGVICIIVSCASEIRFHSGVSNGYQKISESSKLPTESSNKGEEFSGEASYYADKFHGKKTASGEVFNQYKLTCAHKTLPFGTKLEVTNLKNNKTVTVVVNDRGPFVSGRVVDLSKAAAKKIDMIKYGVVKVKCVIK